jgi:hypothetical protein
VWWEIAAAVQAFNLLKSPRFGSASVPVFFGVIGFFCIGHVISFYEKINMILPVTLPYTEYFQKPLIFIFMVNGL